MSLFSKFFNRPPRGHDPVRPVWHRAVELARQRDWYAEHGLADTLAGRFDAVTFVLALILLRMERDPELIGPSVRLTELYVDDMDGQLRESGMGDLVVGKHMGKLMSTLGGRLGVLRDALPLGEAALIPVVERNMSLCAGADPARMARAVMAMHARIDALPREDLLAARFG